MVVGVSVALEAFSILALSLLLLALATSFKGCLLYPINVSSSILAGSP